MFDLREFVMKTLKEMSKSEPAYKVNKYALGWFEKEVLTEEDLAEVDKLTTAPEVTEETAGETEEEDENGQETDCV